MTYENTTTEDEIRVIDSKGENSGTIDLGTQKVGIDQKSSDAQGEAADKNTTSEAREASYINVVNKSEAPIENQPTNQSTETDTTTENCYNQKLDDEIRARLDRLNALSDLINSLERQFDEANLVFRETLKCSTDRLSTIAKALGSKSIRHGRVYHAAKLTVEQSQTDCQKACVQFEQANNDHQSARKAIKEAETKLREIAGQTTTNGVLTAPDVGIESIDIGKLKLTEVGPNHSNNSCDIKVESSSSASASSCSSTSSSTNSSDPKAVDFIDQVNACSAVTQSSELPANDEVDNSEDKQHSAPIPTNLLKDAAKLSGELNQAIMKLVEAEQKRCQSERQHLDETNKLMLAQETLLKLEREHGQSIRRSQLYFQEAKRFDARLNSVKGDICRISGEILSAKQAYAQTLSELEQFSEDLHVNSSSIVD